MFKYHHTEGQDFNILIQSIAVIYLTCILFMAFLTYSGCLEEILLQRGMLVVRNPFYPGSLVKAQSTFLSFLVSLSHSIVAIIGIWPWGSTHSWLSTGPSRLPAAPIPCHPTPCSGLDFQPLKSQTEFLQPILKVFSLKRNHRVN